MQTNPSILEKASASLDKRMASLDKDVLLKQDDKATAGVIACLGEESTFKKLADSELNLIITRDAEDADALAQGIKLAQEKGALEKITPAPYKPIQVMGKSADQVADEIIESIGDAKDKGCVLILVGLSGTGKGTTVEKLKAKCPGATTWSNGNLFRSITLLAATFCEQNGKTEFDPEVLTPENLKAWVGMLEFGKFRDRFDIKISGLGIDVYVSDVANTLLKEPKVSKNIPTVARVTQGEVVAFAASAANTMATAGGTVVLLEGREQTLDYIPTPHRFCLTMEDTSLLGARRAAQRVLAAGLAEIKDGADIAQVLRKHLAETVMAL